MSWIVTVTCTIIPHAIVLMILHRALFPIFQTARFYHHASPLAVMRADFRRARGDFFIV